MKKISIIMCCVCCLLAHSVNATCLSDKSMVNNSKLVVYPAPTGIDLAKDFDVAVRVSGGEWQNVDTYAFKVDRVANAQHNAETTSVAMFDFEGEAEVRVINKRSKAKTVWKIRPLSYEIKGRTCGDTITFRIDRPRDISIEADGDIYHNLQLFANPIDTNVPRRTKQKNLIYLGPGMHTLANDSLHIPSGTTVYIAGGAVVKGWLSTYGNDNIRILGRGIVMPGRHEGVMVRYSKNVEVDGITTTQIPIGGSENVKVTNCKCITWYGWGDGMNVFASNNVSFRHVFCRTSDDCSTIYCTRKGYAGGCRNITVEDAVYWADVAHPIMIGLHGDITKNEIIEDVIYKDIDILEHSENQVDYQGCIGINNGDNILVRNILFDDIRIENIRKGMIINARVCFNKKYCSAPGRGIEDITLRNISYTGEEPNMSILTGYSTDRGIKNITFENLRINGVLISDDMPGKPKWYKTADMANFFVGEHVENIKFNK